jgi:hypothetical protein
MMLQTVSSASSNFRWACGVVRVFLGSMGFKIQSPVEGDIMGHIRSKMAFSASVEPVVRWMKILGFG